MAVVITQKGGTNGGTYASYFTGRLTVTESSYSVENNTSLVSWTLELVSGSSGRFSGYAGNWSVNIDGQAYSGSGTYESMSYNTAQTIASGTTTVKHNDDGSKKNMACSAVMDFASGTYSPGDFNLSGTMDLTTIPRASKITAVDANIESATTININRAVSSFTHTIAYSFAGLTGTIVTKTSDTSVGWQIPSSFYEKIPNAKTGTVTLICTTYNGTTVIGTSTTTFTVTASEDKCKPDISAVLVDSNETTVALTGDNSKLIKYKSTAKITPTVTAKNSASISKIDVNGITVEGESISILNAQSETFTVVATDSRGYTNSIVLEPDIIPYITLLATAKFERLSATSNEVKVKYSGNYYNGSFGNEDNELTIKWAYKIKDDAEWTEGGTLNPTIESNTFSGEASLGEIFDYKKAYEFILYIEDKLSKVSPQDTVKKGEPYFDYGIDAEGNNYLWINGDLYVKGIKPSFSDSCTMYSGSSMEMSITAAGASGGIKVMPFTDSTSRGDALSFDSSKNKIICNQAGKVDIEACINIYCSSAYISGDYILYVLKNGASIGQIAYENCITSKVYDKIDGKMKNISVEAGDYFQLGFITSKTGTLKTFSNFNTFMSVSYIKS